jgi:hypothetical protein
MDVPEFYELMTELFTQEEAEVYCAIPRGFHPVETVAEAMGKPLETVAETLEAMADKGLVMGGGCERSAVQYETLLSSAGLSLERVIPTAGGPALLECSQA